MDGIHYDGLGRIAGEDYSPCLASQPTAQRRRVVGRITFDTNAAPVDLYLNRRAGCLLNASSGGMRALNPSTISSTTAATLGTHSSTNPGRLCPSLDATGQQSVTQSEDWYYFDGPSTVRKSRGSNGRIVGPPYLIVPGLYTNTAHAGSTCGPQTKRRSSPCSCSQSRGSRESRRRLNGYGLLPKLTQNVKVAVKFITPFFRIHRLTG